jgi:hypothetical protein
MALALCLWLCTVPFVILVVGAGLGWQGTLLAVLATLGATAAVCWTLCTGRGARPPERGNLLNPTEGT